MEGLLNCASVLQLKLHSHYLSPHVCPIWLADFEDLQHLFFNCIYAKSCWFSLFDCFNLSWSFDKMFKSNVLQVLIGPKLNSRPRLIWSNAVKAILSEIWLERNQRVFHDKASPWFVRFETARLNASSWCSLSKKFEDFFIQDISINWKAFIFPNV